MISKQERRWILLFAILVFLLTSIPYFIGYQNQSAEWRFTGFVFGVVDGNSYIAKMLRGWMGDWLFRTPYSTVPQAGALAYLPLLLLGKLSSPPGQHEQLVVLYQLFRAAGIWLAAQGTYQFMAHFLPEKLRRWGLAFTLLGGGLGWLLVLAGQGGLFGSLPIDFYSPETFGFLEIFGLPHLAASRGLLMWGLARYLNADAEQAGWFDREGALSGLLWLGLGLLQPLTVVVGGLVIGLHLIALLMLQRDWKTYLRHAVWLGLVALPLTLLVTVQFARDPFLKLWAAQNILPSPHVFHYLLAYLLILPFAVIGIRQIWSLDKNKAVLVFVWLLELLPLVYLPISVQRRLAEGSWAAWIVLGLAAFISNSRPRWFSSPLVLIPLFFTTLFIWWGAVNAVIRPGLPLFRPAVEVGTFETLRQLAPPDSVVLSGWETGNALPAWAPVRVVIGHGVETVNANELGTRVEAFYSGQMSEEQQLAFLDEQGVDYIFWGPEEQSLGKWQPGDVDYLQELFENNDYWLFLIK